MSNQLIVVALLLATNLGCIATHVVVRRAERNNTERVYWAEQRIWAAINDLQPTTEYVAPELERVGRDN